MAGSSTGKTDEANIETSTENQHNSGAPMEDTPEKIPADTPADSSLDHASKPAQDDLYQLPVDSAAFSNHIRSLRSSYTDRRDFNLMLCDELMARGVIPTARLLLDIGGWGSRTYVLGDLAVWKTALHERRTAIIAGNSIPEALQRQLLTIAENMWKTVQQQHDDQVAAPLRQERDTALGKVSDMQKQVAQALKEHQQEQAAARSALQERMDEIRQLKEDCASLQAQHTDLMQQLAAARETNRLQQALHEQATVNMEESLVAARHKLAEQEARTSSLRQEATEAMRRTQAEHKERLQEVRGDHEAAIQRLQDNHQASLQHHLRQIDAARQDAQRALNRADRLEADLTDRSADIIRLKEQIASLQLEHARAMAQELEQSRQDAARQKDEALQQLHEQMQEAHQKELAKLQKDDR